MQSATLLAPQTMLMIPEANASDMSEAIAGSQSRHTANSPFGEKTWRHCVGNHCLLSGRPRQSTPSTSMQPTEVVLGETSRALHKWFTSRIVENPVELPLS